MKRSRVYTGMTRSLGAVLVSVLSIAAPACGGNEKKPDTTPKAGSGSADQSMKDTGDPTGPVATNTTPTAPGNTGGAGPGSNTQPQQPTYTPPPEPQVVPINLDPDPKAAKAQVDDHLNRARQYLSGRPPDADHALAEAKQALTIDGTSVDAAAMVAFSYYHKKLYDTAELVLDDVFKRPSAKNNAQLYYVYGLVYDKTNRPDQANAAFKMAVQLDGNFASALVDLGAYQLKNKAYADAVQTFEKLTKSLNRTDAVTLTSLGSAYRGQSGDYQPGDSSRDKLIQNAEAAYKRAIQTDAGYGPAYYNIGLLYLDSDPYPGVSDPLQRVNTAKTYFDQYKNMKDVDMKLYDERMKDVNKLIKRLSKKASSGKSGGKTP